MLALSSFRENLNAHSSLDASLSDVEAWADTAAGAKSKVRTFAGVGIDAVVSLYGAFRAVAGRIEDAWIVLHIVVESLDVDEHQRALGN